MSEDLEFVPPVVPLFPLPGVVLFPRTIIPLHIFEPRYLDMTADALAGERVIAIAMLRDGWEPLYYTRRAPIHKTVGVGRIVESEQLDNGEYNMLLRGIGRAAVLEEVEEDQQNYRVARIESVETYCSQDGEPAIALRQSIFGAIRSNPGLDQRLRQGWLRLRQADLGLDELVDLLSAGLPADPELRQCLLEEADAFARGQILLGQIRTLAELAQNQRRVGLPEGHSLN